MYRFAVFVVLLLGSTVAEAKTAKASHILMKDKADLEAVLTRIEEEGADFAEEAKQHSTCPSGKKGGDLGTFSSGQMVREFDAVIFDPETEIGKVYGPVKTQFGYHLIKVFERTGVEKQKKIKKGKANEELTAENFKEKVLESKEAWGVEFYSDRCGSCMEFAPIWKSYASDSPPVKTGVVNIDKAENMKLAAELGVMDEGIPNVRLFTGEDANGVSVVKGDPVTLNELKKAVTAGLKGLKKKGKKTGIYRKANAGDEL